MLYLRHTVNSIKQGIKAMLYQITTKSFNVYLKDNAVVSAKCRTTGRFVKRVIAQVELNDELKSRNEPHAYDVFITQAKKRSAEHFKALNRDWATENVKKAINNSLVEKAKVQLQASVAKVAMLGMITLSVFNMA